MVEPPREERRRLTESDLPRPEITRLVRDRRRGRAVSALEFFGDNAGARSWYVPSGDTVTRIIIGKSSGKLLGKSRNGASSGRGIFRK